MKLLVVTNQPLKKRIELWWNIIALVTLSGAFGINVFQPLFLIIFYSIPTLLIQHKRQIALLTTQRWMLWIIIGLAYISVIWSRYPEESIASSILFTFATLYALTLATRYSYDFVSAIFKNLTIIIILLNIIGIITGYDQTQNQLYPNDPWWRGVFYHKNVLGRICVLTFIVSILQIRKGKRLQRQLWIGLAITSVGLILYANSVTALITVISILFIITVWIVLQRIGSFFIDKPIRLFYFAIISTNFFIPAMILFFLSLENVLGILGRDTQLTGRTYLWQRLLPYIWQNPILGYGFGTAFVEIPNQIRFDSWMIHAHNLFLEVCLQLGLGGLILTIVLIIQLFRESLRNFYKTGNEKSLFCLFFLIFVLIYSFSESDLISAKRDIHWVWILFTYFYFSIYNEHRFQSVPDAQSPRLLWRKS